MAAPGVNLVVIGCGAVLEELHLPCIRKLCRRGFVEQVAFVDSNRSRSMKCASRIPQACAFDELAPAVESVKAAIALVASPPALHRQHVEELLHRKVHVLCEKPFAGRLEDVYGMHEAWSTAGRIVSLGMTRRFIPSLALSAEMVNSGELGKPVDFSYREGSVYAWPTNTDAPFRREMGGGVLLDKGVHALDSLLWLFGPLNLDRSQDDALAGGVEGNCRLELSAVDVRGLLQLSWDQPLCDGLRIHGPKGELRVNPFEFRWVEFRPAGGDWERRPCRTEWPTVVDRHSPQGQVPKNYEDCVWMEWIQFLRAVHHGDPVAVDPAGALIVARQMDAALQAAAPLSPEWLDPAEREASRSRHWHETQSAQVSR